MRATRWTLAQTLQRRGVSTLALIKASGLSKGTVYDIVNGRSQGITLETVDKLLGGLERLTGERLSVEAVLAREESADPYAHLFVNAKPFDWEEARQLIPDWTPEEIEADKRFWAEREAEKREIRAITEKRMRQLEEIFGDEQDTDDHHDLGKPA